MKLLTRMTTILAAALMLPQTITSSPVTYNHNATTPIEPRADFKPDYITAPAGNPLWDDFYWTPEATFYEGKYWIFVAPSGGNDRCFQYYFDAFSSEDMLVWTKHDKVLERETFHQPGVYQWATCEFRSPASVFRNGKYYLYFSAGNIDNDLLGGIAVGVADRPEGPYKDPINEALVFQNLGDGGQTRAGDPTVLVDTDGQVYLYFGTRHPDKDKEAHLLVALLNPDMISLPQIDFRDITPQNFSGGTKVFKRKNQYYMMYNVGEWDKDDFHIGWGSSLHPMGNFARNNGPGNVLTHEDGVALSPQDGSVVNVPGTDIWYVVYARRDLGWWAAWATDDSNNIWPFHRQYVHPANTKIAYERLWFDDDNVGVIRTTMSVRDNFDDGNMFGWAAYTSGDFYTTGGKLVGRKGIGAVNTKWWDAVVEADVTLVETHQPSGNAGLVARLLGFMPGGNPGHGLLSHDTDGPNDYDGTYAGISAEGGGKVILGVAGRHVHESLGQHWFPLAEINRPIEMGRSYHLKLETRHDEVRVFVDDMSNPVIFSKCTEGHSPSAKPEQPFCYVDRHDDLKVKWAPPPTYPQEYPQLVGNVGLRVYEATAHFDNFEARRQ